MTKTRKNYTAEFKRETVRLVIDEGYKAPVGHFVRSDIDQLTPGELRGYAIGPVRRSSFVNNHRLKPVASGYG